MRWQGLRSYLDRPKVVFPSCRVCAVSLPLPQSIAWRHRDLNMENHQSPLIDEIATALRKPLEDPHPFDNSGKPRAPNGFDHKLDETCKSGERNVLLDTGFQAWFAYTQSQPRAQLAFDQLPDSEAKGVARYLCTIRPHPTVELLFQHILYESFRAVQRRCRDLL